MGQKVNPHGARVGVIYDWSTRWYAGKKDFANNLVEDYKLRKMLKEKYFTTGISHIDIERTAQTMTVNIFTAKPGMIIGRGGAGIEELKTNITEFLGRPCHINVMEIKQPDADAQLVAENIAQQLEKRISLYFRGVAVVVVGAVHQFQRIGNKEIINKSYQVIVADRKDAGVRK